METGRRRANRKGWRKLPFRIEGGSRGQAIVLVALMLVALVGIAAVAIDGGGLYFLKRDAQNAADAAALAGARDKCINPYSSDATVTNAAILAASSNGFENDGVDDWITVDNGIPEDEFLALGWVGTRTDYVRVAIRAHKASYFARIVFPAQLYARAQAAALCVSAEANSNVRAVTACSEVCGSHTLKRAGSNSTVVGGMWSNDDCQVTGHDGTIDSIACVGDFQIGLGTDVNFGAAPQEYPNVSPVSCDFSAVFNTGKYDYRVPNAQWASAARRDQCTADNVADPIGVTEADIDPLSTSDATDCYHFFPSGLSFNARNGEEIMEGLYFVVGDVEINGGPIGGAKGVTIVATGKIKISGGFTNFKTYTGDNMLLYSNGLCPLNPTSTSHCTSRSIALDGAGVSWEGIVYGPCGECNWSNASNSTGNGAIICNTVDVQGSNFYLSYDPSIFPPKPPMQLLTR